MNPCDFVRVGVLSEQLGYPVSRVEFVDRFNGIKGSSDSGLFVAQAEGGVVGWCHVYGVRLLESEGYAELGALVVDKSWRRRGVGRVLIRGAEVWASSIGFKRLRAYSGRHRKMAHDFYRSVGYEQQAPAMFQVDLLVSGE
ncbi:MAG: GNAT family N-acetyltransferase [Roseibacillus sp.]